MTTFLKNNDSSCFYWVICYNIHIPLDIQSTQSNFMAPVPLNQESLHVSSIPYAVQVLSQTTDDMHWGTPLAPVTYIFFLK